MTVDWVLPIGPYEEGRLVEQSLRSILSQAVPGDRVLVVCDEVVAKALPLSGPIEMVHCNPPEHRTAGAYRNRALENIKSDIVIFQDADDEALPCRRRMSVEALVGTTRGVFSGGYFLMDQYGKVVGRRVGSGNDLMFWFRSNLFLPATAITREVALANKFEESLVIGEDTVFFGNVIKAGVKIIRSSEPVIKYRHTQAKAISKRGINGIRNETRFRKVLLKKASLFEAVMVCSGGVFSGCVKALPGDIFARVYRRFHGG